jgi:hypothetical protein
MRGGKNTVPRHTTGNTIPPQAVLTYLILYSVFGSTGFSTDATELSEQLYSIGYC